MADDEEIDEELRHEEAVEAADKKLEEAIRERVKLGNPVALSALTRFVTWVPGMFPFKKDYYGQNPADDKLSRAPFVCEAYLYALLGKEEARTFTALLNEVCQALGIKHYRDLQKKFYERRAEDEKSERERLERTIKNYETHKAAGHTFAAEGPCAVCAEKYGAERLGRDGRNPNRCRHANAPAIAARAQESLAKAES